MAGLQTTLPLSKVELLWGDSELVIRNAPESVLSTLCYYHKSLQPDPNKKFGRISKKEKVLLYRVVESGVVTTFQGLLDRVISACDKAGVGYIVADKRTMMPPPKIKSIGGFRHGQKMLFLQTLGKNRSGICKAPTRYGKTAILANFLRAFEGIRMVVTAPGVNLLAQLELDLKKWLPGRDIRGIYTGSRNKKVSPDITLVSMDSLGKAEPESVRLLLVDEPHAAAAPSRIQAMMTFSKARIIGFGATITGRFDGADKLVEGIIGPVLAEKTYAEAVTEGAICPIVVYFLKIPFATWSCKRRDSAYGHLIYRNKEFNQLVSFLLKGPVPADWQSIVFIDEIKQADLMQQLITEGVVAVASRMSRQEREDTYEKMVTAEIKRCIATDIYATGLTFPDLRVLINAAGGGGAITSTQKPGRLAQVRPGKKAGYVIDFLFEPATEPRTGEADDWRAVVIDCFARMNNYKKAGFDVRVVSRIEDIKLE